MPAQIRPALSVFVLLTLLTGVAYPALVTAIAQVVFPHRANGSVFERDGESVGSELIGQSFDAPGYFWGRPSATLKNDKDLPYNAAASAGSNLGPTNPALHEAVRARVKALREAHPEQTGPVPVDLVTASASGLDPHISPAAAEFQLTRVAKSRGLTTGAVRKLIREHSDGRTWALLGEPRVHVLKLNLALDRATRK